MSEQDFYKGEKAFEKMTSTDPEEAFGKDNRQKTLAEAIDDIERDYSFDVDYTPLDALEKIFFLKYHDQTKLTLGDFIACDKDGKPLDEPDIDDFIFEEHPELVGNPKEYNEEEFAEYLKEYQQALSRVVYKGWELIDEDKNYYVITDGVCEMLYEKGKNKFLTDHTRVDMAGFELTDNYAKKLYK